MIVTKRTIKLFRPIAVLLGIMATVAVIWWQQDVRIILSDAVVENQIHTEILAMNPQNPEEFWRDWSRAMELHAEHPTVFTSDFQGILDHLTTSIQPVSHQGAIRTKKAWASHSLCVDALTAYSTAGVEGYFDHKVSEQWDDYFSAYKTWNRPFLFWGKLLGSLGLGGGFIWAGLLFLPYLIILILSALVMSGKVIPTTEYAHGQSVVHVASSSGDAPHHHLGAHSDAVVSPQIGWLVIWVTLLVVVIRDRCWVTRGVQTMSTRAPPFRKESVMRRLIVMFCLCLGVASVSTASTLHVIMGEQPNAKGLTAMVVVPHGNFTGIPVFFYDGVTGFEAFGTYTVKDTVGSLELKLSPGLGLGGINGDQGITPYGAAHLGYALNCRPYSLSGSFSARHSARQRFNHLFVANLSRDWELAGLGIAYQPLLTNSWEQRVAVNGWKKFGLTKVSGEVRMSLDERHRTSMYLDVQVPLK